MLLSEIRKRAGKSQGELAKQLGIKQPSLSKLETQPDIQISTLGKILRALGGELELLAKFPSGRVRITQFDASSGRRRNTRASQREARST